MQQTATKMNNITTVIIAPIKSLFQSATPYSTQLPWMSAYPPAIACSCHWVLIIPRSAKAATTINKIAKPIIIEDDEEDIEMEDDIYL